MRCKTLQSSSYSYSTSNTSSVASSIVILYSTSSVQDHFKVTIWKLSPSVRAPFSCGSMLTANERAGSWICCKQLGKWASKWRSWCGREHGSILAQLYNFSLLVTGCNWRTWQLAHWKSKHSKSCLQVSSKGRSVVQHRPGDTCKAIRVAMNKPYQFRRVSQFHPQPLFLRLRQEYAKDGSLTAKDGKSRKSAKVKERTWHPCLLLGWGHFLYFFL